MTTRIPSTRIALCLLAILMGLPDIVTGQSPVTDEFSRIGFQRDHNYFSPESFEHYDTVSGNVILTFTDLSLPGNAGRTLQFQRIFNNNANRSANLPYTRWSFGFPGMVMAIVDHGDPQPGFDFADNPDFIQTWSPVFVTADGAPHTTMYTQRPDTNAASTMRVVMSSSFYKYDRQTKQLFMPDGTVCNYVATANPAVYRLKSFEDLFGNQVEILDPQVDPQHYGWTLVPVRQHLDHANIAYRDVVLTQDEVGRVRRLAFGQKVWQYDYGFEQSGVLADITHVSGPEGLEWTFDYTATYGDVEQITTPNGGQIHYDWQNVEITPLQPEQPFTRHFLHHRDTYDRNGTPLGHWVLEWGNDTSQQPNFSWNTIITTPSGPVFFNHGSQASGHLFDGGFGKMYWIVGGTPPSQGAEMTTDTYTVVPVIRYSSTVWWGTAELQRRTIQRDGQTYVTEYEYATDVSSPLKFPWNFHRPTLVRENPNSGLVRTATRTYRSVPSTPDVNGTSYVLGLPASEMISLGAESFTRSWLYENATGFMTQSTQFAKTGASTIVTTYTPDEFGNVATAATATSSTSYSYSWGTVSGMQTNEHTTSRVINIDGTIQSETKGSRTTTFEYDDLLRTTLVQPPGGVNPTTTVYSPDSIVVSRGAAPLMSSVTTTLDGFGRPTSTIDNVGVRTTTRYDGEGQVIFRSLPFKGSAEVGTSFEYDALGRVTREGHSGGSYRQRTYGPNTVTIRDEEGRQTVQQFIAFGQPDDSRLVVLTDAKQQMWSYGYNVLGRLRSVVAPDGATRVWEYNDQNLLWHETHPESGTTTYVYDGAGRLTQKTDAKGQSFVYTYDGNDRIKTITAGSEVTTFGYEPGSDNRASATVGTTSSAFTYDAAGRPASRTDTVDGYRFTTTYGYDANDNLTSVSYPSLGTSGDRRRVGYDLDAEHRISRVFDQLVTRDFATEFDYHASGALVSYRAGNNIQSTFTYDPNRYWMTTLTIGSLWSMQYLNYDAVGNVRLIADSRAGMNQTLDYDELDRLVSVTSSSYPSNSYTYDAHGNRASASGVPYTYGPTLRLESQNGESYTYDNNGNLSTAPNRTFTYTPRNMMSAATVFGATSTYQYDADDWRVKKQSGTTTTYFLRGLNGELLTEWTNPGPSGTTKDYIYAGSRLITGITRAWTESSDFFGEIIPNGPTVTVSLETPPGRDAKLRFEGVAGQYVSAKGVLTNGSMSCLWGLKVLKPDGTPLPSPNGSYTWGCSYLFLQPILLPESGIYTLMLDQGSGNGTGTADLNLYSFTHLTGTISMNGPAVTPNILWPGQEVHYTFNGTQGQRISAYIEIQGNYNCGYHLFVKKPDGTPLTPLTYSTWGCSYEVLEPITLPSTGVYTLVVDPMVDGTGTATLNLYVDVINETGTITLNGPAETATISSPGGQALFSFAGVSGQRVSAYGLVTSGSFGCGGFLGIKKPDGTVMWTPNNGYCGSMFMEPVTLPDSGTYQLIVDPAVNQTGVAVITAYDVPPDATGSLTVNGAAIPVSITAPGQQAKLTFAATTGQQVTVSFSGNTITMAGGAPMFVILRPDGYWQTYWWYGDSSFSFPQQTLGQTGTYTVVVDPQMMNMGSISVQVTGP